MKTTIRLALAAASLAALVQLHAEVQIARHPADQVASLNAHVTLEVTASITAWPITYQWYGKGALLPDQTSRTLVLNNIQLAQDGEYYVVVNDAENQPVQSNLANITVDPTFTKITEGAIVTDVEPSESSTWWDPNGDGLLDVYVHNIGSTALLQSFYWNNGDGTFTKDTTNTLALVRIRGIMAGVGDYDNDGDQDLYVSGNAHPGSSEPRDDLYRTDGNGIFTALLGEPWTRDADLSQDCSFVDYDRDGLLDIFVVNGGREAPCLYRQTCAGTFVKLTAAQVGSLLIDPPDSYNGSWADYDNDGDPDMFFENSRGHSRLHRNDGLGSFSLATPECFNLSRAGGLGMWGDYDNDGFLDLFVGGYGDDGSYTNSLYRNLEGLSFADVALEAGVAIRMNAWASAWGDFDNDGFLDLFLTCGTLGKPQASHLYQNNLRQSGNANRWLKIKLNGQASNRSGIGAKIRVQATIGGREIWQLREMTGNGFSQTCPGLIAHFGLGDATKADIVRVEWPSGIVQTLTNVPAGLTGQLPLVITEHQDYPPPNPPPRLNRATPSPTGCLLSISEPLADFCYCLEASTDLVAWTKLMSRTSAGGTHEWTDPQAADLQARFYRLVVP
jgi:hypothetical protein